MSGKLQKSTSSIITAFLIGLIIISFMFTGYETLVKSSNHMAVVGDYSISVGEFNREYNNDIKLYGKMMGGKDLSQKQIREYKIRERTMSKLVNRKLMLNLADQLEIHPATEQVRKKIKEFPAFLTDKRFDLKRYKAVLRANALTPGDFEQQITEQIKLEETYPLTQTPPMSKSYLDTINKYKSQKLKATAVKIDKNSLMSHIPISPSNISQFLADKKNLEQVEKLFDQKKSSLTKPEQVRASHILIRSKEKKSKALKKIKEISSKLTVKNFAKLAEKYTEDPSGKKNGGSLGWFSRGRMVPQFEKVAFTQKAGTISKPIETPFGHHIIYTQEKRPAQPALFSQHKNKLAKELMQKKDIKGMEKLASQLKRQIHALLKKNQLKKIETLNKKYNFTFMKDKEFNRLSGEIGKVNLEPKQLAKIFKVSSSKVFIFDEISELLIVKTKKIKSKKSTKSPPDNYLLANRFNGEIVDQLKELTRVKVYNN